MVIDCDILYLIHGSVLRQKVNFSQCKWLCCCSCLLSSHSMTFFTLSYTKFVCLLPCSAFKGKFNHSHVLLAIIVDLYDKCITLSSHSVLSFCLCLKHSVWRVYCLLITNKNMKEFLLYWYGPVNLLFTL